MGRNVTRLVDVDWVDTDPTHLIEYTEANPAAIGWEVKNGVVIVPPPPPEDAPE